MVARGRKKVGAQSAAADSGAQAEHHLVIAGRRWRKSDPAIPDKLRSELVHALMDARRAVLAAKRASSQRAEKAARAHVQDAKLALGERGHPYWETPDDAALRRRAAATIRALLVRRTASTQRATAPTICPSDVARVIGGERWRSCMQLVRDVAAQLVARGQLRVLQRGREVAPEAARGPIRLALPAAVGGERNTQERTKIRQTP
jgi:hypothetical protein